MKKDLFAAAAATLFSLSAFAAAPKYNVNMRVDLKGQAPISINTVAKPGKKSFVSEFSDDGQSETLVEIITKKSQVNRREGLFMDVTVIKRVHGQKKSSEHAQLFAPDNEEMEFGTSAKGKKSGPLALAVVAHQL